MSKSMTVSSFQNVFGWMSIWRPQTLQTQPIIYCMLCWCIVVTIMVVIMLCTSTQRVMERWVNFCLFSCGSSCDSDCVAACDVTIVPLHVTDYLLLVSKIRSLKRRWLSKCKFFLHSHRLSHRNIFTSLDVNLQFVNAALLGSHMPLCRLSELI